MLIIIFGRLLEPENREVGQKLGIATGCMVTLPVLSYYVTRWYLLTSQSTIPKDQWDTYAGGMAIVVTNIIIAIYCYHAYIEDSNEKSLTTTNDDDHPRVGAFKQRTD